MTWPCGAGAKSHCRMSQLSSDNPVDKDPAPSSQGSANRLAVVLEILALGNRVCLGIPILGPDPER